MTEQHRGMGDRRCHHCGALVPAAAEWCGQCFTKLEPEEEPRREFAHADASPESLPRHEYSRTQASATTFGPMGRTIATVLVLIPGLWFLYVGVIGAAVVWLVIVLPISLPAIWKKARKSTPGG